MTPMFDLDRPLPTIGSTFGDDTPRARRSDPVTSHESADRNQATIGDSRAVVLDLLTTRGPMAQFEMVEALSHTSYWSESRIRSACAELVRDELVEFADSYKQTVKGRRAQVWQITKGQAA